MTNFISDSDESNVQCLKLVKAEWKSNRKCIMMKSVIDNESKVEKQLKIKQVAIKCAMRKS